MAVSDFMITRCKILCFDVQNEMQFRILAWYEDLNFGPITSLAFTYDKHSSHEVARGDDQVCFFFGQA